MWQRPEPSLDRHGSRRELTEIHEVVPVFVSKCTLWHQKKTKKSDFQNAVIPQPVGGFLFSTPEMKARDAYVPFLLSKPLNKNVISELYGDINWKNIK